MKIMCLTYCELKLAMKPNDILNSILISAVPRHEINQSVTGAKYVFSYHVAIQNNSTVPIQLKRRHWFISDGLFGEREVEGEGVIGQLPIIVPQSKFEYESWCPIASDFGSMKGYLTFEDLTEHKEFDVEVPPFVLLPEYVLN